MDRPRVISPHRKRIRQAAYAGGGLALLLVTLGLSRLKPAAPTVERSRRPDRRRQARTDAAARCAASAPWCRRTCAGSRPPPKAGWSGSSSTRASMVKADSVILELSNPELELLALDAESQARQAEAQYTELKVRLQSQALDQKAAAARVQADYEQAKMQADTNGELARQGLIADLTRKLSDVAARELGNRNSIEQERLSIASEAVQAQLAVQRALVDQRRAEARLRRSQVQALASPPRDRGHAPAGPRRAGPARDDRHQPGPRGRARPAQGGHPGAGDAGQRRPASASPPSSTPATGSSQGKVSRIDPAAQNGTVTVDVALDGELPQGARPDLTVDGDDRARAARPTSST